jgi:hypothetical protein
VHVERLLTSRLARAEHVQGAARDNGGQPGAEVLDLARVGAAEPQPSVLDSVLGLAERPQHPVGDRAQMRSLLLESVREPLLLIHVTFLPRRVSYT